MKRVRCLTNNPMVMEKGLICVEGWPGISVVELLMIVRQEIIKGYRLVTHPLTGSIAPDKNPYKSIILTDTSGEMDYRSLEIVERALEYIRVFAEKQIKPNWNSSILKDFQLLDLDFIIDYL